MYKNGKTLFLTIAYPPNPAASAVVHRHLLDQFDPASFVVLTAFFPGAKRAEVPRDIKYHFIYLSLEFITSKVHRPLARIQKLTIPILLNLYISLVKPKRIIIGYPDLYWMDICSSVAIKRNIPFIPYLHDTVVEATYASPFKALAQHVQDRIFKHAYKIAVMSEGMRDLYRRKYGIESTVWEHIYPEKPMLLPAEKENRAHWSGDVYEINHKAVIRFGNVLERLGMQFSISNGKTREQLKSYGITGQHIRKVFYQQRHDYLVQLGTARLLLLGLNYSDECSVHEDELATIFSTKTPEYLGSGSLIIYNGPSHYYLADFLTEKCCGVVIDTKDENIIYRELKHILDHYENYQSMIDNAAAAMSVFDPGLVSSKLVHTLDV